MKKRTKGMTMTAALAVLLLLVKAQLCAAGTLTVTILADDGENTLRQALADAEDGDTIDITANGTIELTSGMLLVDKSVTITGPGQDLLTVDGQQASRVFYIEPEKTVTISGLTITSGYALNSTGGGVHNAGTLTLKNCTLSGNEAMLGGGGVFSEGDLTITDCTLSGNKTGVAEDDYYGGGAVAFVFINDHTSILDPVYPKLTIMNSLLTGNEAPYGGGILIDHDSGTGNVLYAWATVTVIDSTLSDNVATNPGGLAIGGAMAISVGGDGSVGSADVTVENCTLSGNSAIAGGSVAMGGAIAIFASKHPPLGHIDPQEQHP